MSLEEAIQSLESRGPSGGGDWRPWRKVRAEALQLLETVPAEALEPIVPRLREVCLTSSDTEALNAAALLIIRCCAATGRLEPVQSLATTISYHYALFDGLRDAVDLGLDVWPMVQTLLPAHADRLEQALGKVVQKQPERLKELPPELAMKTVWRAGLWQSAALASFAELIISTYLSATGETKESASRALWMAASQSAPLPTEKLEERLRTEQGEESRKLSWVLMREHSKRGERGEGLLSDSRPLVRLGAYESLGVNGEQWPRLLEGLLDADPQVRARVLEFARPGIEQGKPFDEGLGRSAIATGHEELQVFLSFVATKYPELKKAWLSDLPDSKLRKTIEAKATRACARCRSLPPEKSWTHSSDRSPALDGLQAVPNSALLRCPDCWAHFTIDYWEEVDVNSKREQWTLRRLKLSELKQRPEFDQTHPRVATWEQAVQEDLHHLEPEVRELARWELQG